MKFTWFELATPYLRFAMVAGAVVVLHAIALWALSSRPKGDAAAPMMPIQLVRVIPASVAQHANTAKPSLVNPQASLVLPAAAHPAVNSVTPRSPAVEPGSTALVVADVSPSPVTAAAGVTHQSEPAVAILTAATAGALMQAAPLAPIVALPSTDAYYLSNAKAPYPRMSISLNEEGTVLVRVLIGVDGVAKKVELKKSSGFNRLDQSALATALKWRYVPGTRDGVAQTMDYVLPFTFKLSE